MKKSILSFGMVVALAAPTLFGVEIRTPGATIKTNPSTGATIRTDPSTGAKIKTDPSTGTETKTDHLRGVYTAPEESNKEEVWRSAVRAGVFGFFGTLIGSKLKQGMGAKVGAAGGALASITWTCGTKQDANWIAQAAAYTVGVIAAWFVL